MSADENARPGVHLDQEGLVEPEGVNAGSAASAAESAAGGPQGRLPGAPTAGGRPEAADEQATAAPERDQVVDAPWGGLEPGAPSLRQSEEEQGIPRA
jgi:hypothetical protein